jgi:syntaxin 16
MVMGPELRGLSGMNPSIERSSTPNPANNYYTSPSMLESETDKSYSQNTLQTQTTLTSNDAAIMQREREITDIAQSIIELADIFKELQTMIIDQGTMLDRIDYNVERMAVDVKAADKELKVASGYQRKGTKRRIIFLLILLVVGMIILLIVKPKKHGRTEAQPPTQGEGENGVPP